MISSPTTLLAFLHQIDAAPNKRLSQNFLIDANIVRKIADAAEVREGETVLEIGPGPGALTEELLLRKARVLAVEKDPRFAQALCRLDPTGALQVVEQDILAFSFEGLFAAKVIANLPYHITTPILERLCMESYRFTTALLMVQKEVADRMVAKPHTKQMGSFTIFLKTFCEASIALKVSRNCFYPAPDVDSCVVKLVFKKPLLADPAPFLSLVRQAYQQRRKMLRSTLSIAIEPYATLRPEALSYEEWLDLYSKL